MRNLLKICTLFFLFSGLYSCLPEDSRRATVSGSSTVEYESEMDLSGITVGYCTPTLDAPFYVALEAAVRETTTGYGMNYLSTDGQADISKQVAAAEDLLAKGVDVLILNPMDPKALVPVVEHAHSMGVKVFIVDSYLQNDAPFVSAVFADNTLNGELLGAWLDKQYPAGGFNIGIISGNQGNPVGREKRLGFLKGYSDAQLHRKGKVELNVVSQGWGSWTNNGGLKAMEDMLVAHPEMNVLVAENDAMAMGALKAIQEMNLQDKIIILGFDAQKEALELIRDGKYAATAQNSPAILGRSVVELVAKYYNNPEGVEKLNFTPSVLVDKTNVSHFYNPKALF